MSRPSRRRITPKTKAIFIEVIANPGGVIIDIEAVAKIARKAGVPLIVDNTLASPYLCRPFEHGADIVIHSLTKFLGGHGNSMGGVIVDGGKFDWLARPAIPSCRRRDPTITASTSRETFGDIAFAIATRVLGLRDLGPALSPINAFLILTGIETLPLRMQRHCDNALTVAEFLADHKASTGSTMPGSRPTATMTWPRNTAPRAPARSSPSASRAAMKRA